MSHTTTTLKGRVTAALTALVMAAALAIPVLGGSIAPADATEHEDVPFAIAVECEVFPGSFGDACMNAEGSDTETFRATVTNSDGDPIAGQEVSFEVTSGAQASDDDSAVDPVTCTTDDNGQCTTTLTNVGSVAGDEATVEGSVNEVLTDSATKSWSDDEPVATYLTLTPETAVNTVGTDHTVTATVYDQNGEPLAGQDVDFDVTGNNEASDDDSGDSAPPATDANGQTSFTYTDDTDTPIGEVENDHQDVITAFVDTDNSDANEDEPAATAHKSWTEVAGLMPTEVTSQSEPLDEATCVAAQVVDENGDPIAGETVQGDLTAPGDTAPELTAATGPCPEESDEFGTAESTTSDAAVSDDDGYVSFTFTPEDSGDYTLDLWVDTDADGVMDAGEGDYSTSYAFVVDDVLRLDGSLVSATNNRITTAIAIAQDAFPEDNGASAVVLSRSDTFPDALAGTPFAADVNGPILLTPSPRVWEARGQDDHIDPDTLAEIRRVLVDGGTIYLLGRTAAIGEDTEDDLVAEFGADNVVRIGGEDRFETAVMIAEEITDDGDDATTDHPDNIFVASGRVFADALAGGAAAAHLTANAGEDTVIVLTEQRTAETGEQVSDTSLYLLAHDDADTTSYALGGPAATAYPNLDENIVGQDRLYTSQKIADKFFTTPEKAAAARANLWADALTGGVHIGLNGGPMLLSVTEGLDEPWGRSADSPIDDWFEDTDSLMAGFLYGGTAALSANVDDQLDARIRPDA